MLCLSGFELYSRWVPLKEVGKAWRKSNMRKPYTSFPASFQTFCVTAHAYLNTQKSAHGQFVAKNMETSSASSRHDDVELPNFDLNLFGTPPSKSAKRFANLSERELNHMVEQRHSEKTKKTTNWSVSTFRGKPSIVTSPQCFPAIL